MVILFLVIGIAMVIVGVKLSEGWDTEAWGVLIGVFGIVGIIVVLLVGIALGVELSAKDTIPNKIEVLEKQNSKIETQINAIAEDYLEHEGATYDKLTPDNAELFAVAYPQLASNETVKKQMDVYISNNNKITDLKLEWCERDVLAWWLYFGGGK